LKFPSIKTVRERFAENRFVRKEWFLLFALMAFVFVPSINQLIVDRLVSGLDNDLLNVAGQIEWFDLLNETLLAFLIIPLYFVFNKVSKDENALRSRIMQTLTLGFIIYIIVSVFIYFYASSLSSYMSAPSESVEYLRLETVGFVLGFISAFMYVVFVVRGKWTYIVLLLLAKVAMLSVGNLVLIPEYGVMGIAMTNIIVNSILLTVSMLLLRKEGLLQFRTKFDKDTMRDYTHTGILSGSTIFLDNIIYMLIIVKMVNEVSSVGMYWLANNFIWGWLLIPIIALVEIVKKDYYKGYSRIYNYLALTGVIVLIWVCTVPLWGVMFTDVVQAEDPQGILNILYLAVPFYVAWALAAVIDGVLISVGKVKYILWISLIVNIGYYGIVYSLFLVGFFEATLSFIITMFGCGMVVHLVFSILFFLYTERRLPDDISAEITADILT
jgi:Na+-driven multidrug efflux pump